jgi:hypothetical protein
MRQQTPQLAYDLPFWQLRKTEMGTGDVERKLLRGDWHARLIRIRCSGGGFLINEVVGLDKGCFTLMSAAACHLDTTSFTPVLNRNETILY